MNIYTIRLTKRKIVAAILILAAIIAAIILIIPDWDSKSSRSTSAGAVTTAKVKSSGDCVTYAGSLGYEVRPEPVDTRQVTIPKTFDAVYSQYNTIQKENGFDLEKYCGKGVTLYTFYVTNYTGHDDVLIDLLIYKSKVVGGAVYTAAIDGFMHGLMANPNG